MGDVWSAHTASTKSREIKQDGAAFPLPNAPCIHANFGHSVSVSIILLLATNDLSFRLVMIGLIYLMRSTGSWLDK